MYTVKVHSHFSAAHNLRGYQGRCENMHGHNWKVEVELASQKLNKLGMVCDFKIIKTKLEKVLRGLDHSDINKLAFFRKNNPTSEKIAEFIYYSLKRMLKGKGLKLRQVAVWETETSSAVFSDEDA